MADICSRHPALCAIATLQCQMAAWQAGHHTECRQLGALMSALQGQQEVSGLLAAALQQPAGREAALARRVLATLLAGQPAAGGGGEIAQLIHRLAV